MYPLGLNFQMELYLRIRLLCSFRREKDGRRGGVMYSTFAMPISILQMPRALSGLVPSAGHVGAIALGQERPPWVSESGFAGRASDDDYNGLGHRCENGFVGSTLPETANLCG